MASLEQALEQNLPKVTQRVEQQLDAELDRLDRLDGHEEYTEILEEKEIFEVTKKSKNVVCQWVKHFKDGNTSIKDEPRHVWPRRASTECNEERVDEIIEDDRCVTVGTIALNLGIGHSAVQEMIESLGYTKVCARWVPWLLTKDHKEMMEWRITQPGVTKYHGDLQQSPDETKQTNRFVVGDAGKKWTIHGKDVASDGDDF
ncbi:hypothetical protein B7P43_G12407 [Cryptotermes secundus]|uniref:Uncharacterized protein n=1 Tax=Cryptotermes secundus TaxID=105785 RepID=A0A2J7Q5R4_9NEOP|nr:hypothetical protein B7P43_G12407 [Cryptotermes secundus]